MKARLTATRMILLAAICIAAWCSDQGIAQARCDTLGGPVVMAARTALEKGDVTPVLKWVKDRATRSRGPRISLDKAFI